MKRTYLSICIISMLFLFAHTLHPNEINESPYHVTLGGNAEWPKGKMEYDPSMPGYYINGDIGVAEFRPATRELPKKLVVVIDNQNPVMGPNMENFSVSYSNYSLITAIFDGTPTEEIREYFPDRPHRTTYTNKGAHVTFEIEDNKVRVTLLPKLLAKISKGFTIEWLDWYRE